VYEKKTILQSDPYKRNINTEKEVKNIYWGQVISINDETDGGRIQVRLPDLDSKILNENIPWAYPMLPKFFHLYPKVGEIVRIFIEDTKYPQRSRFWMGSVISQLHKINFDAYYTALSTTNIGLVAPEKAPSTYPDAKGVFPELEDIALIGRDNTDFILREKDVEIRAGKHEINNILSLNKKNPASVRLTYEVTGSSTISSSIVMADRIGLISHSGNPKYKFGQLDQKDRNNIFNTGHPIARGDVLVDALEVIRKALLQHLHPYSNLPSDKSGIIIDLEKIDFSQILQKNIITN